MVFAYTIGYTDWMQEHEKDRPFAVLCEWTSRCDTKNPHLGLGLDEEPDQEPSGGGPQGVTGVTG